MIPWWTLLIALAGGALVGIVVANEWRLARRARRHGGTIDLTLVGKVPPLPSELLELDWSDPR